MLNISFRNLALSMVSLATVVALLSSAPAKNTPPVYLSPGAMAVDEARGTLYTALTSAKKIAVTPLITNEVATLQQPDYLKLKQNPNNLLLSPDGNMLIVACGAANGSIEIFKTLGKKRVASIGVGHTPEGLALSMDGKTLYVAERFGSVVDVIDIAEKRCVQTIPTLREPRALCLSPDGRTLAVGHFLPMQPANGAVVASTVTLIDTQTKRSTDVVLANGSQSVEGLAFSPDGKYLYAVHTLSQYNALITQLERGWVNTAALSIIDVASKIAHACVLLDDIDRGAANPAGVCLADGKLFVALAGTHELMSIDLKGLQEKIDKFYSGQMTEIASLSEMTTSFAFMAGLKQRLALEGRSPRSVVFANGRPIVSCRFATFVEQPAWGGQPATRITLGEEPAADAVRRGEQAFCDATICYQQWQSCVSCHPDGRADGLNWDQMNDGLGNPKNTKSLLFSHVTPPCMITGIRASAELAVRKGIEHTFQSEQPESLSADIDEYLKNMRPLESPFLVEYKRKDPRQHGKALFEKVGCARCHNGSYLTDRQKYNVGSGQDEYLGAEFDTPSLCEVWRTAPYLYNGRAVTLREMLTTCNPDDLHGKTQNLSNDDLEALILYIKTL